MPHSRTTEILRAAADRFDRDRLVFCASRFSSGHVLDYVGLQGIPYQFNEVWERGDARAMDLGSVAEAVYRVDHRSFKAEYLLKWPGVWLVQSLWWVLHPELSREWLDLGYAMDMWRRHEHEGLYPDDLRRMVDALFRPYTTARNKLTPYLSAGYEDHDHFTLMGGALWSLYHILWIDVVLHYTDHSEDPQGAVGMPEGMASYLLADLREEWLPGPWHEGDERQERWARRREEERKARLHAEQGDGEDGDGGQG